MKFHNAFRSFFRNIKYSSKWNLFIFSAMLLIVALGAINLSNKTPYGGGKYGIFDILVHVSALDGITGRLRLVFPVLPAFIFILIVMTDSDNRVFCLIRCTSREGIWKIECVYVILLSLIFSIIIVFGGYILSGILVNSFQNLWNTPESYVYKLAAHEKDWPAFSKLFVTYKMLPITFVSYFLGLNAFGFLVIFLKTLLKNIYVYIIVIAVILSDAVIGSFSLVLNQMTISLENWVNPFSILINCAYLLFLIFLLYFLGKKILCRKDFIM